MIEVKTRLRRWGRSFGVVIPMEKIKREKFSEDEEVTILISKEKSPMEKHFGTFKFKKPIKEILDEGNRDSWDE